MTEEEAKTKWCPQVREGDYRPDNIRHANCIGSACMAWQWVFEKGREDHNFHRKFQTKDGFCGLVGKP